MLKHYIITESPKLRAKVADPMTRKHLASANEV